MTDFDKKLIEKAEHLSRYDYRDVDVLIASADTDRARRQLEAIRSELYMLVVETI